MLQLSGRINVISLLLVAMAESQGEVVLVTGVNGFLGRHVLNHLIADETVAEIRGLDKSSLDRSKIPEDERIRMKFYQRDLIDAESCRDVLKNVDVVVHCAALVAYEFPPPRDALVRNNVLATENLIKLCVEENVSRFVNCSTTEVALEPYHPIVAELVYFNETKIGRPKNEKKLIFGEYAASKLRAEKIVLESNGKLLANGEGILRTVSLRPSLLYGEGDGGFITSLLRLGQKFGGVLPRVSGVDGKQQIIYVGNAAWAFVCAKNMLRNNPDAVSGLAINITDDTPVDNVLQFCENMTKPRIKGPRCSDWSIPTVVSFALGWILEMLARSGLPFVNSLPISPRSAIAYLGSLILYDRTRASIHLNYEPRYSADEAMSRASAYYCKLLDDSVL